MLQRPPWSRVVLLPVCDRLDNGRAFRALALCSRSMYNRLINLGAGYWQARLRKAAPHLVPGRSDRVCFFQCVRWVGRHRVHMSANDDKCAFILADGSCAFVELGIHRTRLSRIRHQRFMPPRGHRFVHVSLGGTQMVALLDTGEPVVWNVRTSDGRTIVMSLLRNRLVRFIDCSVGQCGAFISSHVIALNLSGYCVARGEELCGRVSGGSRLMAAYLSCNRLVQVSTGFTFSVGVTADGKVVRWGRVPGITPIGIDRERIVKIVASQSIILAITDDGLVMWWGLYNGTLPSRSSIASWLGPFRQFWSRFPSDQVPPPRPYSIVHVSAAWDEALILYDDGRCLRLFAATGAVQWLRVDNCPQNAPRSDLVDVAHGAKYLWTKDGIGTYTVRQTQSDPLCITNDLSRDYTIVFDEDTCIATHFLSDAVHDRWRVHTVFADGITI